MNLKSILIIALCVLGVLVVFIILGYTGVWPNVVSDFVLPKLNGDAIAGAVSNPISIAGYVGTAASVGGLALTQINSAKQQALQAKNQVANLTESLADKSDELQGTQVNLEAVQAKLSSAESATTTANSLLAQKDEQIKNLQVQLEALNNIQATAAVLAENKEVVRTIVK